MDLRAVVGLVPPRAERLRLLRRLQVPVPEHPDQELAFRIGAVGRYTEIDVVQAGHARTVSPMGEMAGSFSFDSVACRINRLAPPIPGEPRCSGASPIPRLRTAGVG